MALSNWCYIGKCDLHVEMINFFEVFHFEMLHFEMLHYEMLHFEKMNLNKTMFIVQREAKISCFNPTKRRFNLVYKFILIYYIFFIFYLLYFSIYFCNKQMLLGANILLSTHYILTH